MTGRSARVWSGDWERRLQDRVQKSGCHSLREFAEARLQSTYDSLAQELGEDVAVVQLETILAEEYRATGDDERFARSSLVRNLRKYLEDGWKAEVPFIALRAYASWKSMLGSEFAASAESTWRALVSLGPPDGWHPSGPDDSWIAQAFEEGWART